MAAARAMLERFGLDATSARVALGFLERIAGFAGQQGGDMMSAIRVAKG